MLMSERDARGPEEERSLAALGMTPLLVPRAGEDYLYDKAAFRQVTLPQALRRAVLLAA